MQTFLPYASFTDNAQCLDRQRLGKQRVEAFQILKTLLYGGGWQHHPVVRMWAGSEQCLVHWRIYSENYQNGTGRSGGRRNQR